MTDFITSLGAVSAPAPATFVPAVGRPSAVVQTDGRAGFGPALTVDASPGSSAPPAGEREGPAPLRLSIDRADDGVFVYTLKDPQTGALVAVIPRAELADAQGAGRTVDRTV